MKFFRSLPLKLPPALMHFGMPDAPAAMPERRSSGERRRAASTRSHQAAAGKALSTDDPLIDQVIKAMQRMSKEDAARLVTISKALIGEGPAEGAQAEPAIDLKPLPAPDLAPHPPPAFNAGNLGNMLPCKDSAAASLL